MDAARTYSSTQVMRMVGITYRQLDYWCRSGFIPGMAREIGSGCQREFSDEQVEAVRRVKGIMDEIAMLKGELDSMRVPQEARPQPLPVPHAYRLRDLARTG